MRDLGKLIVAKGLKKLPKVQKIAQSGHTGGKVKICASSIHRKQQIKIVTVAGRKRYHYYLLRGYDTWRNHFCPKDILANMPNDILHNRMLGTLILLHFSNS